MSDDAIYTARATVTGGRAQGRAQTDDGGLDLQLRMPSELGGEGGGTNPEELFAVGFAACFEGALGTVARRERLEIGDVSIASSVSIYRGPKRTFKLGVQLDVTLPAIEDQQQASSLVAAAHRVCPYSNATRNNIEVKLTANAKSV
jgi:osmotically inducible protein OsmC